MADNGNGTKNKVTLAVSILGGVSVLVTLLFTTGMCAPAWQFQLKAETTNRTIEVNEILNELKNSTTNFMNAYTALMEQLHEEKKERKKEDENLEKRVLRLEWKTK